MVKQVMNNDEKIDPLNTIECQVQDYPVELKPAVNFNQRKPIHDNAPAVDIILIHYTAMETAQKAIDWLCCEESQVSCHYLIDEDGKITQMVSENMRAWHAGKGSWQDNKDVNSTSIGIELANIGPTQKDIDNGKTDAYPDFPEKQIKATIALIKDIQTRHTIPAQNILAHSDIAPSRKFDPGERFPWQILHENDIGLWIKPEPISSGVFLQFGDHGQSVEALQTMLQLYGYGIEINGNFDETTKHCVAAFQRHFRQTIVDGIADASTVKTLHNLLKSRNAIV